MKKPAFYLMNRKIHPEGALLYGRSHRFVPKKGGEALGADVQGPFLYALDEELRHGPLPTFFTSPAVIATTEFYDAIHGVGVNNIQAYEAVIIDEEDDRRIGGYLFLNIVGLVSCADLDASEAESLGEGMLIINQLVLDGNKVPPLDIFLVAEDTDNIIVSERVYRHLSARGYDDVYFEELQQT